mgnify:CR=1 FL=1
MKRKRNRKKFEGASVVERSCTLKTKHLTEALARMSAKRAIYTSHGRIQRMWTYPCEFCDGWHVTSRLSGHGEAVEG